MQLKVQREGDYLSVFLARSWDICTRYLIMLMSAAEVPNRIGIEECLFYLASNVIFSSTRAQQHIF